MLPLWEVLNLVSQCFWPTWHNGTTRAVKTHLARVKLQGGGATNAAVKLAKDQTQAVDAPLPE